MKKIFITDVDNTLFDWVDIWYHSFSAMLREAASIMELSEEDLYSSISAIHQKYGTSEYAFLLEELPQTKEILGEDAIKKLQPAIDAYRLARRKHLKLYPGVMETLISIRDEGYDLIAYTESQDFYTQYRFIKLGLDEIFSYLYSPKDQYNENKDVKTIRTRSQDQYKMKTTKLRHTPAGELKPNPDILKSIIHENGGDISRSIYVGDSKMKDIAMAQAAGVRDAWAKYGEAQSRDQYALLKQVTHWTPEMVAREAAINSGAHVVPTYTLEKKFNEILDFI